ncbi:MAG: hypothetical protein EA383_16730 [Spirochaetaceae bacterium]|nr:MAG: hypothetical protein EA383_16730 [Spirochaetaceae bacterium]
MSAFPDRIHHFSWTTRVSIELPIGFEEESFDEDTSSVIYADDLDEDDEPGARVLVKATGVADGVEAAHLQMLEQSAQLAAGTAVTPEPLEIDGYPAATQQVRYHQPEIEADVVRTECCAQVGNVLFSVVCLAFAEDAEHYAAAFEHALRTLRFVLPDDPGVELLVSANIPDAWDATRIDSVATEERVSTTIGMRYFAAPQPELDGYRPTLSITCGEPEGYGEEWFDRFCEGRLENTRAQFDGFTLNRHDRFMLSSLCTADVLWFEWDAEPGLRFTQMQALIQADRYRMYVVNAATRVECADEFLPQFESVLHSVRILPPMMEA